MTASTDLYTVTASDFDERVLTASERRLILVDFWASWCGPCRSIAPFLEQLVAQFSGKMAVAKVDTDAEQSLAGRFGIRSLPTLVLFKNGAAVEQLVGAQSLAAVVALINRHLDRDSDGLRAQAGQALGRGERAIAQSLLHKAWMEDPENTRTHPEYAALLIDGDDLALASQVLDSVPSRAINDAILRQQARLRFAQLAIGTPSLAALQSLVDTGSAGTEARFQWAIRQVIGGDYDAALAALLEIVRSDRRYADGAARKAMLDIFAVMSEGDPLLREYRTLLARAIN